MQVTLICFSIAVLIVISLLRYLKKYYLIRNFYFYRALFHLVNNYYNLFRFDSLTRKTSLFFCRSQPTNTIFAHTFRLGCEIRYVINMTRLQNSKTEDGHHPSGEKTNSSVAGCIMTS